MFRHNISKFKDVLDLQNYRRAAYATFGYGSDLPPFQKVYFVYIVYSSITNYYDTLIEVRTTDEYFYSNMKAKKYDSVLLSRSWFENMLNGSSLLDNMVEVKGHIMFKETKQRDTCYASERFLLNADIYCFMRKYGYALAVAANFPEKFKNLDEAKEAYELAEKVNLFKWTIGNNSQINHEIDKCQKEIQSTKEIITTYDGYLATAHDKKLKSIEILKKYGLNVV